MGITVLVVNVLVFSVMLVPRLLTQSSPGKATLPQQIQAATQPSASPATPLPYCTITPMESTEGDFAMKEPLPSKTGTRWYTTKNKSKGRSLWIWHMADWFEWTLHVEVQQDHSQPDKPQTRAIAASAGKVTRAFSFPFTTWSEDLSAEAKCNAHLACRREGHSCVAVPVSEPSDADKDPIEEQYRVTAVINTDITQNTNVQFGIEVSAAAGCKSRIIPNLPVIGRLGDQKPEEHVAKGHITLPYRCSPRIATP